MGTLRLLLKISKENWKRPLVRCRSDCDRHYEWRFQKKIERPYPHNTPSGGHQYRRFQKKIERPSLPLARSRQQAWRVEDFKRKLKDYLFLILNLGLWDLGRFQKKIESPEVQFALGSIIIEKISKENWKGYRNLDSWYCRWIRPKKISKENWKFIKHSPTIG